jgi:hypothetical protein
MLHHRAISPALKLHCLSAILRVHFVLLSNFQHFLSWEKRAALIYGRDRTEGHSFFSLLGNEEKEVKKGNVFIHNSRTSWHH